MWRKIILLNYFIICSFFAQAQFTDSTNSAKPEVTSKVNADSSLAPRKKFYKTKVFRALAVPTVLIGYGVSTIHGNGLYSSFDAYRDINKLGLGHSNIDDYLQYAPYAELVVLNLLKIKCKNDFLNTGLLIVKSQLIMTAIVFPIKKWTGIVRPDSVNPARNHSFPSGHTANAFVAASIVHREYRHKSPWYGVGAYAIAASVGAFRMINNRHWQADVFTGAGIGMLSVHLAYLTHQNRWGRKCDNWTFAPTYINKGFGLSMAKTF